MDVRGRQKRLRITDTTADEMNSKGPENFLDLVRDVDYAFTGPVLERVAQLEDMCINVLAVLG
jgi:hypothetical protein